MFGGLNFDLVHAIIMKILLNYNDFIKKYFRTSLKPSKLINIALELSMWLLSVNV